jgi:hypothetical protein
MLFYATIPLYVVVFIGPVFVKYQFIVYFDSSIIPYLIEYISFQGQEVLQI